MQRCLNRYNMSFRYAQGSSLCSRLVILAVLLIVIAVTAPIEAFSSGVHDSPRMSASKSAKKAVKLLPIGESKTSDDAPARPIAAAPAGTEGHQKNDWFYKKRAFPEEYIDPSAFAIAAQQAKAMPRYVQGSKRSRLLAPEWQEIGPFNIGGRVTSLATHPTDPNTIYVGAASGGVWKTTDKGKTFKALTDTFSTLPVGTITIDPASPETIYMGQGEVNYSADSWPGQGIWRSDDGGATWKHLGLAKTQYIAKILIDPRNSNVIYVAAPGPVALGDSNRGVYKSTDRGTTWMSVLRPRVGKTSTRIPIIDLAMNPTNPDELVAAAWDRSGSEGIAGPNTGLWYTSNAGAEWSRLDTLNIGYPDGRAYNFNRTVLHWANTSEGPVLFAAISRNDTNVLTKRNNNSNLHGLYRSSSPLTLWTKLQDSTLRIHYGGLNFDSVDVLHRQGYYNFYLAGNPRNGNELYLGGIDVLRSTDAGKSFANITHSYGGYYFRNDRGQHPDQHHLAFTADASGSDLLVANDGGVFHTTNFGESWSQFSGLPITMFYSLTPWYGGMKDLGNTITPEQFSFFGGTQDNGTVAKGLTPSGTFDMINNADGGVAIAHPTDPEKIFVSKQQGRILLRTGLDSLVPNLSDKPSSDPEAYKKQWHNITAGLITGADRLTDTSESVGFIAPYAIDQNDPTEFFTGRMKLYRAKLNYANPESSKWYAWSPYFAGDTANPKHYTNYGIEAIAVGPQDAAGYPMLWAAGIISTNAGALISVNRTAVDAERAENVAPRWINVKAGLPVATPSMIVADPSDSLTAFISFARYSTNTIYKTTNGGKNWASVSGKLPSAPVNALVFDREAEGGDITKHNQYIFAATDVGVFMTRDGGVNWFKAGDGLPTVVVSDVKIYKNLLIAGTHGRSAWAIDITALRSMSDVASAASLPKELAIYPNPVQLRAGASIGFELDAPIDHVRLINIATGADAKYRAEAMGSRYELSLPADLTTGSYIVQVIGQNGDIHQSKLLIH